MITATDIVKHYGGVTAVNGVSLHIDRGETVGLIGTNGAGKTTLFNILTGFERADKGKITYQTGFNTIDISKVKTQCFPRISISRTFQNVRLFDSLTVEENLMAAIIGCKTNPGLLEELLDRWDLKDKRGYKAGQLSFGERKQLELVRALCTGAQIIFIDELMAGVSAVQAQRLAQKLAEIKRRQGLTLVMIEHNMEYIVKMCDRVYVLDQGRIVAKGLPKQVLKQKTVQNLLLGTEE